LLSGASPRKSGRFAAMTTFAGRRRRGRSLEAAGQVGREEQPAYRAIDPSRLTSL